MYEYESRFTKSGRSPLSPCERMQASSLRKTVSNPDQLTLQKWRIAGGERLQWRYWDGDYVVFNPLSGQTHLLDIVTGKVLMLIMSGSSSATEFRSEISTFLEVDDDNRLSKSISDILSRLEEAGLIEPLC